MSAARPSRETKLPTANSRDRTLARSARDSASVVGRSPTSGDLLGAERAGDDVVGVGHRQHQIDARARS